MNTSLLSLVMLVASGQPTPPKPDTAIQVIEKAKVALGELTEKGEVVLRSTGKKTGGGRTEHYVQTYGSDKIHYEGASKEAQYIVVFDGKNGWITEGGITRELTRTELDITREMAGRGETIGIDSLTDTKRFKLTLLPERKAGEEDCIGIRVQSENQPDSDIYFSKTTYLPRRMIGKKLRADGKTYDMVVTLSEYKRFSGQFLATKINTKLSDQISIDDEIEKVEYIPLKQAQKLFEKP